MVHLLHRYIFKELLIGIGISFSFFLLVLVLANAIQDLSEMLTTGKLGFKDFFQLLLLLFPYLATYAIPLSVLSGIFIAFGRFSADNEITAMKTSGFSLFQMAASVFFIAFIGMAFSAMVTLHYGPKSVVSYKTILANTLINNPLGFIQEGKFIKDFPGYILYTNDRDGAELKDLWIWELDESNELNVFLRSESGVLSYDLNRNALVLDLKKGSIEERTALNVSANSVINPKILYFESLPISLSLERLLGNFVIKPTRYKNMTLEQLLERRTELIEQEQKSGTEFSQERGRLQVYIHQNLSQAYSVFALALIGIPLAIRVGRKESYINILLALLIALLYHILFVFSSWIEGSGALRSDLLVWLPNVIFQILGIWLFARVLRH